MRVHAVIAMLALSAPLHAQAPARIQLADLVAEAVATNPEIVAAQRRYDAASQRPAQERSLPDPMIAAGYSSVGKPWPGAGLGSDPNANIGVMVTQQVPYPGKLDLRASIASREADAAYQEIDAARLAVAARVKQAYYRLAYTYAAADVLTRNRTLLDTLLQVSEQRYAVGKAAQQDVIKAQTQVSILDLQRERIRQEQAAREGELNALLARPAGTPLGIPDDLELAAFDISVGALIAQANEGAPLLRRDQLLIDRWQLAVDAARKESRPDFAFSGGYFTQGSMPPMYEVRIDATIPLRKAKRAAAIAEQLSGVHSAQSEYDSNRLMLQARIEGDYRSASTSLRLARLYRDSILPQAQLALESSMAGYQTGAVDFLSVVTNFAAVLDHQMTYFDELASFHIAVSRLEEMTGTALVH